YLSPKSFLYFVFLIIRLPPISTLFPYTTLFRSERRDRGGVDVLQAREFTRGCRLQLLARARLRAREVRLARGVGAGKPELCVEVEAAYRRRQRAPHGRRRGRARGRGGRRARRRGGRGAGRARAGLRRRSHDLEELVGRS